MAKIRSNEFLNFVKTRKSCTHGALVMRGNLVRSYNMIIAIVDRDNKQIYMDDSKVSVTTSAHQNAVRSGFGMLDGGWALFYTIPFEVRNDPNLNNS